MKRKSKRDQAAITAKRLATLARKKAEREASNRGEPINENQREEIESNFPSAEEEAFARFLTAAWKALKEG